MNYVDLQKEYNKRKMKERTMKLLLRYMMNCQMKK